MYELLRTEDFNTYIIRHFQCDSDADLDAILTDYATTEVPKNALHAGWTAVVIGSGSDVSKPYVLDNTLANWSEIIPFPQIDALEEKVDRLEGKTTRLLYSGGTNPTASDINTFVTGLGYTSPFEGIAVVVAGTYHIWHYYENDGIGWRDDGLDTITPFTNSVAGSILGSADDGKISANNDGTGSVNGWSDKLDKQTGVTTHYQVYTKASDGTQAMTNTAKGVVGGAIVVRENDGQINVPNQENYVPGDDQAISKRFAGEAYLAKQTGTTSWGQVYAKLSDGTQGMFTVVATNSYTPNTIAQRTATGQIHTATPTDAGHAANKGYVDNGFLAKQTGATTYYQVYGKLANGSQAMQNVSETADGSIVKRKANGRIYTPTPSDTNDASNKAYVDNNFLAKQTGVTTYAQVYYKENDGTNGMLNISSGALNGAVVRRNGTQINVPETPTETYHAASKAYVDNKLTATLTQLSDGTYSLTFGV